MLASALLASALLASALLASALLALSLVDQPASTMRSVAAGLPVQAVGISGRMWRSAKTSSSPQLLIVLHGDLAGPQDDYQYAFAKTAADHLTDSVVIAPLRPGYADAFGARSLGYRGLATGDNYTPQVLERLRAFIEAERAAYHARSVTLVGHSGGAAIAADIVEDHPALASRLLLVSCPCDLQTWRPHMALLKMNPVWLLPVESQSPLGRVRLIPRNVRVVVVTGARDMVAPPRLSVDFARATSASILILTGAGHNVLLDPRVMKVLVSLQESP